MSGDEVSHLESSAVRPALVFGLVRRNKVNYRIRSVLRMTLGLGTAAPLPVGTISHMAAARLTTARPAKMIR